MLIFLPSIRFAGSNTIFATALRTSCSMFSDTVASIEISDAGPFEGRTILTPNFPSIFLKRSPGGNSMSGISIILAFSATSLSSSLYINEKPYSNVTMTVTGIPLIVFGVNFSCLAAAIACSVKPYGKAVTGVIEPTSPDASSVTLSLTEPSISFLRAASVYKARAV